MDADTSGVPMPDTHPPTRTASLSDWARLIARPTISPGGGSAAGGRPGSGAEGCWAQPAISGKRRT